MQLIGESLWKVKHSEHHLLLVVIASKRGLKKGCLSLKYARSRIEMLSRAYLPLARLRPLQTTARRSLSSTPLRYKAIKGKPRDFYVGSSKDYRLPVSVRQPQQQQSQNASSQSKEPLRQVPKSNEEDVNVDESGEPDIPSFQRPNYEGNSEPQQRAQAAASTPDVEQEQSEPQGPLPDITRGIPSTLAAELERAQSKGRASKASLNITEDPGEALPADEGDGPRDRTPRSEYVSSSDRKKRVGAMGFYAFLAAGLLGYTVYLGRNWESEELEKRHTETAPSGWGFNLFWNRAKARWNSNVSYYSDPVTTKLLPDEEKDPAMRLPFTLVLSLDDLMVHSEWTRSSGWRIAKRPGLDYFLRYLSQYYELVLFTTQPFASGEQVMRKLDPYMMVRWPLYREATLYKDGGYIKVCTLRDF